jgi:hypothetical protein
MYRKEICDYNALDHLNVLVGGRNVTSRRAVECITFLLRSVEGLNLSPASHELSCSGWLLLS